MTEGENPEREGFEPAPGGLATAWSLENVKARSKVVATLDGHKRRGTGPHAFLELRNLRRTRIEDVGKDVFFFSFSFLFLRFASV
jgi:hypothetical protein